MTPEDEERVRQILAGTPAGSGMPADVVARLDATLAGLVAERARVAAEGAETDAPGSRGPGAVDELERRRRRRWPKMLVAAASVVLIGYGVSTVAGGMSGGVAGSASAPAMDGAGAGSDHRDFQADGRAGETSGALPQTAGALQDRLLREGRPVPLRRETLRRDVAALVSDSALLDTTTKSRNGVDAHKQQYAVAGKRCFLPDIAPRDEVVAARLDGRRSTLVLRTPVAGTRVAEVYSCGDPSKLLAITRVDVPRTGR